MFESPASHDPTTGWSTPALVTGIAVVAIGVSGLLDDTGLAEHPYWIVPATGLFAACAAVAGRTVRRVITARP